MWTKFQRSFSRLPLAGVMALGMLRTSAALPETPVECRVDDRHRFQACVPSEPGSYYQLLRSPDLVTPGVVVGMALGDGSTLHLSDSIPTLQRAFFRVRSLPRSQPMDWDLDGVDDVQELLNPASLNPFNPARQVNIVDGANHIPDHATFEALSHRDNFPGAFGVREVKFLILGLDTRKPEIYFLNNKKFVYHYYFATDVLGYNQSLSTFNRDTYWTNTARKNLAGSLIEHESYVPPDGGLPGVLTMEFWPSDPVTHAYVQTAYNLISKSLPYLETRLAYHAASETQRTIFKQEKALYAAAQTHQMHVVRSEDLFGQTTYTMMNPGVGFGRLMIFDGSSPMTPRDVVVFHSLPNAIPHLGGIITEVPQTPLSHVNLAAKQNNTPNAYVKNAGGDALIQSLLGKYVRYETLPEGYTLREATQAEVDEFINSQRPPNTQYPIRNLSYQTILPLPNLSFGLASAYGSKTANVAQMRKFLPAGMVPDGWGVPFYFYDEFMKFNSLYTTAQSMMAQPRFISDPVFRGQQLKLFRDLLKRSPAPATMYTAFETLQNSFPAGQAMRCRSSTNHEDLVGFSGAGLYDSYTHYPDEGPVFNTIRQVWASLWTERAWEERDFYRVDHSSIAMGVLIHPNSEGERANGVGVTKNPFDPAWSGYYINAQAGENLVTNPLPNSIPEEFLIAPYAGATKYEIQYVTFSNQIPEDQLVLTRAQAELLADQMSLIQYYFKSYYKGGADFGMEIEWKILANGALQIKQARPWVD